MTFEFKRPTTQNNTTSVKEVRGHFVIPLYRYIITFFLFLFLVAPPSLDLYPHRRIWSFQSLAPRAPESVSSVVVLEWAHLIVNLAAEMIDAVACLPAVIKDHTIEAMWQQRISKINGV